MYIQGYINETALFFQDIRSNAKILWRQTYSDEDERLSQRTSLFCKLFGLYYIANTAFLGCKAVSLFNSEPWNAAVYSVLATMTTIVAHDMIIMGCYRRKQQEKKAAEIHRIATTVRNSGSTPEAQGDALATELVIYSLQTHLQSSINTLCSRLFKPAMPEILQVTWMIKRLWRVHELPS